ncbi:uncharacterized protein LOC106876288 [Octopus bimaculoides]|uniref:Uncharacterized protein n=1 Tax=Octopus bimaculoides TaxID=37653 RepID=A0A0L8GK75_OCTBM|nr:uncharacterized protein LOC106876288 [Octopus bimaculoides]|eukprot:XP_014780267.1 PREDICTED: uncharacterized protein LOC106876288 [Octopus bimaculoides]
MGRITNIVIFSLFVFCQGIYAAVNIETKITEGKTSHGIALWQEMMYKRRVYEMLNKKITDIGSHDGTKNSGLQNRNLECIWKNVVLTCNATLPRLQTFSVILRISKYLIHITVLTDGNEIKNQIMHMYNDPVRSLSFTVGSASVLFSICVENRTEKHFRICFRVNYSVFFFQKTLYLGCFNKPPLSSQNISLDSVKDSLQFSDTGKFRSVENNVEYLCYFMEDQK